MTRVTLKNITMTNELAYPPSYVLEIRYSREQDARYQFTYSIVANEYILFSSSL